MKTREILRLSLAEALAYLRNIAPLISREAAIRMPWDAMVSKKDRPSDIPDFFIIKKRSVQDMTPEERMVAIGQISVAQQMRAMAKQGLKASRKADKSPNP